MTTSIAELPIPAPRRPMLRRLVDILPATPATAEPPPAVAPPPPDPGAPDPAAAVVVERVLRAAVEILGGRRPARQLSAVLRPDLLTYLVSLRPAAGHLKPRLRKVLVVPQAAGALEAVALLTLSTGVRALAARFEQHREAGGPWRCTALQVRFTPGDLACRHARRPQPSAKAPTLPTAADKRVGKEPRPGGEHRRPR